MNLTTEKERESGERGVCERKEVRELYQHI